MKSFKIFLTEEQKIRKRMGPIEAIVMWNDKKKSIHLVTKQYDIQAPDGSIEQLLARWGSSHGIGARYYQIPIFIDRNSKIKANDLIPGWKVKAYITFVNVGKYAFADVVKVLDKSSEPPLELKFAAEKLAEEEFIKQFNKKYILALVHACSGTFGLYNRKGYISRKGIQLDRKSNISWEFGYYADHCGNNENSYGQTIWLFVLPTRFMRGRLLIAPAIKNRNEYVKTFKKYELENELPKIINNKRIVLYNEFKEMKKEFIEKNIEKYIKRLINKV